MERIANKSRSFVEAETWDIQQQLALTPQERMRAAQTLKKRLFPGRRPDVRECHRQRQAK